MPKGIAAAKASNEKTVRKIFFLKKRYMPSKDRKTGTELVFEITDK